MASTNAGLCQGNMTWCHKIRGSEYNWIVDLYERLNLPILPSIVSALQKAVRERASALEKQKSQEKKSQRIRMKIARAEDQETRKKWGKQQALRHTYGREEIESEDDEVEVDENLERDVSNMIGGNGEEITVISGKRCRCGSRDHSRTSHRLCPLNKKK